MKSLILLASILIFLSTNPSTAQSPLMKYQSIFAKQLKEWTSSYTNFHLSDFILSDSVGFVGIPFGNIDSLFSFYKLYKPSVTFSPDGKQFIDIYSYLLNLEKVGSKIIANPEVDQAVSLCNLKTKKWIQILFLGVSRSVEEVVWISSYKFILLARDVIDDKITPIIYLGDIKKKRFLLFSSKNPSCKQKPSGYISPKFKKLNISEGT